MDKFAALEPVRLYPSARPTSTSAVPSPPVKSPLNRFSFQTKSVTHSSLSAHTRSKSLAPFHLIGRLPVDLHILILTFLAVPDIPAYSRACRAFANLARDERVWDARWDAFGIDKNKLSDVLDSIDDKLKLQNGLLNHGAPPILAAESVDDEFGDFAPVESHPSDMGHFAGSFGVGTPRTPAFPPSSAPPSAQSSRACYIRAHTLLNSLIPALSSPPHAVLSNLFPPPAPSLRHQAHTLRLLSLFLSPAVKPLRNWQTLSSALRAAIDRFEDGLLTAFDVADGKSDELGMREAAEASWEVWDGSGGEWELGRVWAEKLEIFYEQSRWKPLDNFTYVPCTAIRPLACFISLTGTTRGSTSTPWTSS